MANEALVCINECIVNQGPLLAGANIILLSILTISLIALLLFGRKLSVKANFFLKSLFLTSFFVFLVLLSAMATHGTHGGQAFFHTWHQLTAVFIIALFVISFFLSSMLMKLGLQEVKEPGIEGMVAEESEKLRVKKPGVFVFRDSEAKAFIVSGFSKTFFISTALAKKLDKKELRLVVIHELMHLKSGFFNAKRLLNSIKSSFFGLLPIHLAELDILEESRVDKKMNSQGLDLDSIRKKI